MRDKERFESAKEALSKALINQVSQSPDEYQRDSWMKLRGYVSDFVMIMQNELDATTIKDSEILDGAHSEVVRLEVWARMLFFGGARLSPTQLEKFGITGDPYDTESFWEAYREFRKTLSALETWLKMWQRENLWLLSDEARFIIAELRSDGSPKFFQKLTDMEIVVIALKGMWGADSGDFSAALENYDEEHSDGS